MIRNKSDFSFPVQKPEVECRTQMSQKSERDNFS